MFNLIVAIFSVIERFFSLLMFFIKCGLGIDKSLDKIKGEYIKECITEMGRTLDDMMEFYRADHRLTFDVSNEIEKSIKRSLRIAPYIQDKDFDNILKKMVEIFPKIKYLDLD